MGKSARRKFVLGLLTLTFIIWFADANQKATRMFADE